MTIAVDFDGVIHDEKPLPGYRMGRPLPGAKETINRLVDQGHLIIVHSVRCNTAPGAGAVQAWLDHFKISGAVWTQGKPNADIYLDDRGIKFTNWDDFNQYLEGSDETTH